MTLSFQEKYEAMGRLMKLGMSQYLSKEIVEQVKRSTIVSINLEVK